MKNILILIAFLVLASSSAFAETVMVDDSVNFENYSSITDRIMTDTCTHLVNCQMNTQKVNLQNVAASSYAKNVALQPSTFNSNNLTARIATTTAWAAYSPHAVTAVWADRATSAPDGFPSWTAGTISNTTTVLGSIEASTAFVAKYAAGATSSIFAFDCDETSPDYAANHGACVGRKFTRMLRGIAPTSVRMDTVKYARTADNYSTNDFLPWVNESSATFPGMFRTTYNPPW